MEIKEVTSRIAREFNPERIVLFGSHAYGAAHGGSDVDLLVIMKFKGSGISKAIEILRKVQPAIPVELIVRTPEDIDRRIKHNDYFLREIIEKGVALYESPH